MKKVNVAILGLGTVGGGTYNILLNNHDAIMSSQEMDIRVARVLERSADRLKALGIPQSLVASDIGLIADDPSVGIVVEAMGGIEPAKTFIIRCLRAGKNIVTANKELIAKHWAELEDAAKAGRAGIYFEASCMGGVPIIRTLTDGMQANNIGEIMGIYNGTTNYILSKMTDEKVDYNSALREAQALGYAERDPTSDVEGYDTTYKLSILASLAFNTCIPYRVIYREGIDKITPYDIESGRELGYVVKLLAIGKKCGNKIEVRVHPAFVPAEHMLAGVRGSFNAIHLTGDNVGEMMMYGRGAGDLPTGSAIVSDIVYCSSLNKPQYAAFENNGALAADIVNVADWESRYYFMIACKDAPGVLAKVTSILGGNNVSIDTVIQRGRKNNKAFVLFLTHMTSEKAVQQAISEIRLLNVVDEVVSLIRVID